MIVFPFFFFRLHRSRGGHCTRINRISVTKVTHTATPLYTPLFVCIVLQNNPQKQKNNDNNNNNNARTNGTSAQTLLTVLYINIIIRILMECHCRCFVFIYLTHCVEYIKILKYFEIYNNKNNSVLVKCMMNLY